MWMEQDYLGVDNGRGNRALHRRRPACRRSHNWLSEEIFLVVVVVHRDPLYVADESRSLGIWMAPLFDFFIQIVPLMTSAWSRYHLGSGNEVSQSISHYAKKFSMEKPRIN